MSRCKYCGEPIVWDKDLAGNWIASDPSSDGIHQCQAYFDAQARPPVRKNVVQRSRNVNQNVKQIAPSTNREELQILKEIRDTMTLIYLKLCENDPKDEPEGEA